MEINKHEGLTPLQQFRYELLQWCGKTEDAAKAYQFVIGTEQQEETAQNAQTAQLQNNRLKDGVYLVIEGQAPIKFEGEDTNLPDGLHVEAIGLVIEGQAPIKFEGEDTNLPDGLHVEAIGLVIEGQAPIKFEGENTNLPDGLHVEAIGLVMGDFSIKIALQDEAEGKRIPLTTKANGNDPKDDAPYYIESYEDAIAEMDGDISTEHLKPILNPDIKLQQGWYIPSLGELYRIFINLKEVNAALEFIGETPLYRGWYWTSTEGSATNAWLLNLGDGNTSYWCTKASNTTRVRAVSAFINA